MTLFWTTNTDNGLSYVDAMTGQWASARQVEKLGFFTGNVNIELPPREELFAHKRFSQKPKYYPSQSAKTLLKGFSELIRRLCKILDKTSPVWVLIRRFSLLEQWGPKSIWCHIVFRKTCFCIIVELETRVVEESPCRLLSVRTLDFCAR